MNEGSEGAGAVRGGSLNDYVAQLAREGYVVITRSADTAQLTRKKRFSVFWAIMWFLFFGIGVLAYLIYYAGKRDDTAYLAEQGGYVSGTKEYTKIRYNRLGIGVGLVILAFIFFIAGASVGGGGGTVAALLGFLCFFVGVGAAIASLFGSRRREQIGTPPTAGVTT